jgi:hypothetical protein
MLTKVQTTLMVAVLAGFGVASDVAFAKKSAKHARPQMQSAPVYLPQGGWSSNRYQNWDGWVPPPAHAGGVG